MRTGQQHNRIPNKPLIASQVLDRAMKLMIVSLAVFFASTFFCFAGSRISPEIAPPYQGPSVYWAFLGLLLSGAGAVGLWRLSKDKVERRGLVVWALGLWLVLSSGWFSWLDSFSRLEMELMCDGGRAEACGAWARDIVVKKPELGCGLMLEACGDGDSRSCLSLVTFKNKCAQPNGEVCRHVLRRGFGLCNANELPPPFCFSLRDECRAPR